MAILSPRGVPLQMIFRCCDCGIVITGQEVHQGYYLTIVRPDPEDPAASDFRCEACQDDRDEAWMDARH